MHTRFEKRAAIISVSNTLYFCLLLKLKYDIKDLDYSVELNFLKCFSGAQQHLFHFHSMEKSVNISLFIILLWCFFVVSEFDCSSHHSLSL